MECLSTVLFFLTLTSGIDLTLPASQIAAVTTQANTSRIYTQNGTRFKVVGNVKNPLNWITLNCSPGFAITVNKDGAEIHYGQKRELIQTVPELMQ